MERFDAIVIGSGQGGTPLCRALAQHGWSTALVEREHVGGTCVNVGCTPTKTMVASARVAWLARRAGDYGVRTGSLQVDMETVRGRKRDIVDRFRGGSEGRLEKTDGLTLIRGEARFEGPREIAVGDRRLTAERIFVNTGARPSVPDLPGLRDVPFLDSTSIMELGRVPRRLVVLGGGYIGLEFGQMFRRLGAEVAVVQRSGQLLPREDADMAEALTEVLRQEGVEVRLNAKVLRVESGPRVVLEGGEVLEGSHLLVAVGRTPNTDSLQPERAGLPTDRRGFLKVNERLETGVEGVWALGDVTGGPAFTHISYDDFRILRDNLLEGGSRTTGDRPVPYVVFTDPELARVGLSEKDAREQGLEPKVYRMPMSSVARALEMDESRGQMKALVDPRTDRILGFQVLGVMGGELMSCVQMAMQGGLTVRDLRDAVFAHPVMAECLNNLFS